MNEQDTRLGIMAAAEALLLETDDIEKITVRQIAQRAGVGTGLINYHFKSKDNLLDAVIGGKMAETIAHFAKIEGSHSWTPVEKLKKVLEELYGLTDRHTKFIHFMLLRDITGGGMQTPLYLVPFLKEIFPTELDDINLRVMALQLLYPIQVTGLDSRAFYLYSGIDLSNKEQRKKFIDLLVDNLTVQKRENCI